MRFALLTVGLMLASGGAALATTRYVDINSPAAAAPYTTWNTAATSIQWAIDASSAGDEIIVKDGTYSSGSRLYSSTYHRIVVDKAITLRSANGPGVTIIQGGPLIRGVYLASGATLSGFTIRGGSVPAGAGVWCESTSSIVYNSVITGNNATLQGGGIYSGTVKGCSLSSNSAIGAGGGAYRSTLSDCKVFDNSATTEAGGLYGGSASDCVFWGNSATLNGGAAAYAALVNCSLSENTAANGGGAYSGSLNNCITYYNTAAIGPNYSGSTLNYSCTTPLPSSGSGNISAQPLFVYQTGGDLHLQSSSPCIDAGLSSYATTSTDADGAPRIAGARVDMGAFEYSGSVTTTPPPADSSSGGSTSSSGSAPVIARIANQVISLGASAPTVSFTIGDDLTPAESLSVSASSGNAALVPNSNLVLGGTSNSRTIKITPVSGVTGNSVITIRVSDGSLQSTTTFNFTVVSSSGASVTLAWDPSTATSVTGYKVYQGTASRTYSKSTSVGSSTTGTLTGLVAGQLYYFAVTAISSTGLESDYSNEISYRVPATISPNTAPSITSIPAITVNQGSTSSSVGFTISDAQTASGSLLLSASSANTTLLPNANITLGGSGDNRTIQVTPAGSGSGTVVVTVSVSDGSLQSSVAFLVTVTGGTSSGSTPSVVLSAPSTGGSFTAPANITLAATVTPNGQTISKVQFYNGSTLLGEDTSFAYTYNWTGVPAGTYNLTARAVYGSGTVSSSTVTITVGSLAAPWLTQDFGGGNAVGSASISGGIYTVAGSGYVSGSSDNFRFVYQSLTADGEIRARLNSFVNGVGSGGAYVMIRESLSTGSPYAAVGISPNNVFRWQQRTTAKATSTTTTGSTSTAGSAWFRLVRSGSTIIGYVSSDGSTWTEISRGTFSMASNIYIGLASASGVSYNLGTATFSNVSVTP